MKTLAIIPAKSTSQGIPNKNLVKLGDRELLVHTVLAADRSTMIDWIILASDDAKIFNVTGRYDDYVLLPKSLTVDTVQVDEAVLYTYRQIQAEHALDCDTIIVLQPTSPFRTSQHIDEALQLYKDVNSTKQLFEEKDTVFSVWEPGWSYSMVFNEVQAVAQGHFPPHRLGRQNVDTLGGVTENGAIYIVDTAKFSKERTFRSAVMIPYYMDKQSSIEIDEPIDLAIAEAILAYESSS
jgi:CMP-N,N'-diacetyllegionaminic acid synthase